MGIKRDMSQERVHIGTLNVENNTTLEGTLAVTGNTDVTGVLTHGALWKDALGPITSGRQGAAGKPDFDETNVGYLFPKNDTTEVLYIIVQFNHDYKEGTDIYPHIHWEQTEDVAIVFKIDYEWTNNNAAPAGSFTTISSSTKAFTYSSGTLAQISYAPKITGTGKKVSSILKLKVYRDDNVGTGDVLVTSVDLHYQVDSPGSASEYTK